jgi:uncharacterized damage-inducible protein DinB
MSLADALAAEFEHEAGTTRKLIARVPDDRASWKPHGKSMSLGELAIHLANIESYGLVVATTPELNFVAPDGTGMTREKWSSRDAALELFDRNVEATLRAVRALPDARMREPWTMRAGDHVVFTLPRIAAWRTLVMSHQIHHRGQLSVYLRLNDVPVPPISGPSADEQ